MDESYYYEQLFKGFIGMAEAENEQDVSEGMRKCLSAIEHVANDSFARVARSAVNEVSNKLHDSAVRAAGGV